MPDQCDGCKYYRVNATTTQGECHVNPPVSRVDSNIQIGAGVTGQWPVVKATDWCGQWTAIGT